MNKKVTIYTQVYNTKPYLDRCISSVLSQTYTNFEYILVDNGCTDGSSEIMNQYAQEDQRIRLIRFEKNTRGQRLPLTKKHATGEYYTILDSDDWWEADYLEQLVAFTEENSLDIACTGSVMHFMDNGTQSLRKTDRRRIIASSGFADNFPWYHVFFRAIWGKLIRMDWMWTLPEADFPDLIYGADTLWCFQLLRGANRIGIDNSVLHHYRIHKKSVSYQYDPRRFKSDVFLYNDAVDFLAAYGPISRQNRDFLQAVYSNAIIDTINVIHNADLSPADKLREYRTIAEHPLTRAAYRECADESAERSRKQLVQLAMLAGIKLEGPNNTDLCAVTQVLLLRCGQAVTGQNLPLFIQDQDLLQALLRDDPEQLLRLLLALIRENRYIKKYNLPGIVKALAADKPLLCQIEDSAFLRKYTALYLEIWQGETLTALEEMTGLLLEDKISGGAETLLQLYISLAALEEQVPAFLFGKMRLAWLYLRQDRREECLAVADELTEMGLDSEELTELRQALEEAL